MNHEIYKMSLIGHHTLIVKCAKIAIVAAFVSGLLLLASGRWIDSIYRSMMPLRYSNNRPVELSLDHGKRVFVTQGEYERYQKYEMLSNAGIVTGMLAAFAYAWLKLMFPKD